MTNPNASAKPSANALNSTPRPPRNYPLNCWWVAATAAEVSREPLARWLLDAPVVLHRTEAGDAVALDDRCIHRWAPLSAGYLEGDHIVCAYHGARFGPDGRCVRFPTQSATPSTARVRSYPLIERGPFIWIWMGDLDKMAAAEGPPDLAWASDPSWTVLQGGFPLEANYMLLHENVLDLTHFNYLHRNSFKITNRKPPKYRAEGDKVYFQETYVAAEMSQSEREAMRMGDPFAIRQETEAAFSTPAIHEVKTVFVREPNPMLPERMGSRLYHLLTPVNASRSHYWWILGVDLALPPIIREEMQRSITAGYDEDKAMLTSIQNIVDHDPRGHDYPELSFDGDAGGVLARRALARLLAAEIKT